MTQDQIMALIDTFAEAETSFWFGLDEVGTKFDTDARRNRDQARAAVVAAIDALTKDAERYRFIRVGDPDNAVMGWVNGLEDWTPWASPEDVDQAIDEAIAAIKEQV